MNPYIGHDNQVYGVEEFRVCGGRGDGQKVYEVNNGLGISLTVSPDRAGDIPRLRFKGVNMNYVSPRGFVAPAYCENRDASWLRSFMGGFLATCGLDNVGVPNGDNGEELCLHGTIGSIPCEQSWWTEEDGWLIVHCLVKDETLFARKLRLDRQIAVSTKENVFEIRDRIINCGHEKEPVEILYHMNMGYPLLDEDSVITIPSADVRPRDDHAATGLADWMHMQKPTPGYQEMCYYHSFPDGKGQASIYQPKLDMGLTISFDSTKLDAFVEWKMMGCRDYVLGLECGNCYPDGRDAMRKSGMLKFLEPDESVDYVVRIELK